MQTLLGLETFAQFYELFRTNTNQLAELLVFINHNKAHQSWIWCV